MAQNRAGGGVGHLGGRSSTVRGTRVCDIGSDRGNLAVSLSPSADTLVIGGRQRSRPLGESDMDLCPPILVLGRFHMGTAKLGSMGVAVVYDDGRGRSVVVSFQLGYTPIAIATGMAVSFIGPIFYHRSGDATSGARNANVHELASRITVTCLGFTFGFAASVPLHQWIFDLPVGHPFRGISQLLPWVLLAGGSFAATEVLALKMMSDLKSAAMLWPKIVTALFGLASM